MGNLGRLVCAYCLLKDDKPFVSGSYMTVDCSFKKLRKMGPMISTRK